MSALLDYIDRMDSIEFFAWFFGVVVLTLLIEALRVSRLAWARGHLGRTQVNHSPDEFLYTHWG